MFILFEHYIYAAKKGSASGIFCWKFGYAAFAAALAVIGNSPYRAAIL